MRFHVRFNRYCTAGELYCGTVVGDTPSFGPLFSNISRMCGKIKWFTTHNPKQCNSPSYRSKLTHNLKSMGNKRPKNLHPLGRVSNAQNTQQTRKICKMTSQVPYTTTSHNIYITLLGTIKTNYERHKFPKRVTQNQKNRFTSVLVRAHWLSVSPA